MVQAGSPNSPPQGTMSALRSEFVHDLPGHGSHVGGGVNSAAVLEVAARLLAEGLARLDADAASALGALRQAYALERQFGHDAERLCRACAAVCRGLARQASPAPPVEAVTVLLAALETLEAREGASGGAGSADGGDATTARAFLASELLGLARRLAGGRDAQVRTRRPLSAAQLLTRTRTLHCRPMRRPRASPWAPRTSRLVPSTSCGVRCALGLPGPGPAWGLSLPFSASCCKRASRLRVAMPPPSLP